MTDTIIYDSICVMEKEYSVVLTAKTKKMIKKMPVEIQDVFTLLVEDIKQNGAILKNWRNFSALGKNKYHCHLKYNWVACWIWEKGTFIVEIYYAGSRENAPY